MQNTVFCLGFDVTLIGILRKAETAAESTVASFDTMDFAFGFLFVLALTGHRQHAIFDVDVDLFGSHGAGLLAALFGAGLGLAGAVRSPWPLLWPALALGLGLGYGALRLADSDSSCPPGFPAAI